MEGEDEQRSRFFAFQTLLDGSRDATEQRVEMTTLRKVCARGIPNRPVHLRPLSYNLLLEALPAEKRSWRAAAKQDRERYYKLLETFMQDLQDAPTPTDPPTERDALLQAISREVDLASKQLKLLRRRTAPSRRSPLHAPPTDDSRPADSASESSSSEGSELDESLARIVENEFAMSSSKAKGNGKGKGKGKAKANIVEYMQCRRALFQRLEMLAVAEHQRQADARRKASGIASTSGGRTTSSGSGKPQKSGLPALPIEPAEPEGPILSPRITLSPEPEEQSTMASFASIPPPSAGSRSSSLQTPKLSLTPSDPPTSNSTSSRDPITLVSPKPIPSPGHSNLSFISGSLLQAETHAECLMRLLYVFCQTHPQWAYKSQFVDIAVPLYLVYMGPHGKEQWAEEQTFWALAGIMSDLGHVISADESELQPTLDKLGRRVKWADYDLYDSLRARNLDPSAPLFAYQWMTGLFTNTLPPPAIFPIWDFLLSEAPSTATNQPKTDLLLDLCVALLILLKPRLNHAGVVTRRKPGLWGDDDTNGDEGTEADTFVNGFNLLQSPPLARIGGVDALLETAFKVRQARRLAGLSGDDPDSTPPSTASYLSSWAPSLPTLPALPSLNVGQFAPTMPSTESLSKTSASWTSAARSRLWTTSQTASAGAATATSSLGAAAGRLWGSVRGQEPTPDASEYDFAPSGQTTPELKAQMSPPPKFVEPKDTIRHNQVPESVLARRQKSEAGLGMSSSSSVGSIAEKFSNLASSLTGSPASADKGAEKAWPASGSARLLGNGTPGGPRPLILRGSARRASNSSSTGASGRYVREGSPTTSVVGGPTESLSPPSSTSARMFAARSREASESSETPSDITRASLLVGSLMSKRIGGAMSSPLFRALARPMAPAVGLGLAGLATSARLMRDAKAPNYPDHVPLNAAQNALLAVGSGIMGVLDTTRGDLVATLSESTASTFLPSLHASMVAHPEGRQIMKDRPIVSSQTVNLDHLRSLKRGTLGREYVEWLQRDNLSPDSREKVRYIDSPTLAYTMLRYRQTHDLYHTLFSLPPTLVHELSLKVVELANMSLPVAGLSSTFGPLRLSSSRRQLWSQDWVPWALRTGQQGRPLVSVYWEKRWEQGLGELRQELGVKRNDNFGVEGRWRGYRELREMERELRRKGEWVDEPEQW